MAARNLYIDFHCHPELKTFLSSNLEKNRKDCWEDVDVTGLTEIADMLIGNPLDSQSSLSQIKDGHISIALAGLYAFEKPMITGEIFELFKNKINLLKISRFIEKMDQRLLRRISSQKTSYFKIFNEVQNHLQKSAGIKPGYKLLNKISEYEPGKLNVILTIEGGHALYDQLGNDEDVETTVLNNLHTLKNSATRYFFLTLTHLVQIPMCTQAYGIKLINDDSFIPIGYGISNLGKKVIANALDNQSGNRILIDVKHMSLKARLQYYDMLQLPEFEGIPVIASHCGVTGVSYREMPVYRYEVENDYVKVWYHKPQGLLNTKFNPWSINLYDEEIPVIINSGGIIGITLDERILGTKQKTPEQTSEYFSKKEFNDYQSAIDHYSNKYMQLHNKAFEEIDNKISLHNDLKHICNNILHIVKTGGEKAWKHICIGSDFDGIINAVECCKNSEKYKKLARNLINWLPKLARADKSTDYYIGNIKDRVNDIMFGNAYRFLEKHFD